MLKVLKEINFFGLTDLILPRIIEVQTQHDQHFVTGAYMIDVLGADEANFTRSQEYYLLDRFLEDVQPLEEVVKTNCPRAVRNTPILHVVKRVTMAPAEQVRQAECCINEGYTSFEMYQSYLLQFIDESDFFLTDYQWDRMLEDVK